MPEQIHKTNARQGATPRVTRYVLAGGLILVVIAFVIIYAMHAGS